MTIKERLSEETKSALKARNQFRVDTLRFLSSAIKNREIELRPEPIKEDEVTAVIKKMAKQRKESIDQFLQAGRQDLVDKEKLELAILEEFLPKAVDRAEVEKVVAAVISDLKASTIKEMGAVMKESMNRLAGAADNKVLSEIIRSKLQ